MGIKVPLERIGKFYFECENNWLFGMVYFAKYNLQLTIDNEEVTDYKKLS